MTLDFPIEFFAQDNHVLAVTGQILLTGIAQVPDARLAHKVEPPVVDDSGFFQLHIGTEEVVAPKMRWRRRSAGGMGTALLHAESIQHFKCAGERDSSALLPDRQGSEEKGTKQSWPHGSPQVG